MEEERITGAVIGSALAVHKALGPGLLESTYEQCLCVEMTRRRLSFERQALRPLVYEGVRVEAAFRIDLLVEDRVVVELKAVEELGRVHTAQLVTYLKLTGCRVGLLINFNVPILKQGLRRVVLSLGRSP